MLGTLRTGAKGRLKRAQVLDRNRRPVHASRKYTLRATDPPQERVFPSVTSADAPHRGRPSRDTATDRRHTPDRNTLSATLDRLTPRKALH
jgi:hypothetical protein